MLAFTLRISLHWAVFGEKPMGAAVRFVISTAIVAATLAVGLFVRNVGVVFGFAGALAQSMLCLIMPAGCTLKLRGQFLTQWERVLCYLIIVFGVFIAVLGVISNINESV